MGHYSHDNVQYPYYSIYSRLTSPTLQIYPLIFLHFENLTTIILHIECIKSFFLNANLFVYA